MKKLLSFVVAALMLFGICTAATATTIDAYGDWAAELRSDKSYAVVSYSAAAAAVTVPDQLGDKPVTQIAPHAFLKNTAMQSLAIPEGVTGLGEFACMGCTALTDVTLPSTLRTLGEAAFSGDGMLTRINIGDTVIDGVPSYAFADTAISEVELPTSCTYIEDNAFLNCGSLQQVLIPRGVTEIGESAFAGCGEITVLCEEGSYAEEYAVAHGCSVSYVSLFCPYIKGDADGDGIVSIMDATKIQRLLAHYVESDAEAIARRGDADGDGVNIMDATSIQRKLAGMGNPYGIGETVYH